MITNNRLGKYTILLLLWVGTTATAFGQNLELRNFSQLLSDAGWRPQGNGRITVNGKFAGEAVRYVHQNHPGTNLYAVNQGLGHVAVVGNTNVAALNAILTPIANGIDNVDGILAALRVADRATGTNVPEVIKYKDTGIDVFATVRLPRGIVSTGPILNTSAKVSVVTGTGQTVAASGLIDQGTIKLATFSSTIGRTPSFPGSAQNNVFVDGVTSLIQLFGGTPGQLFLEAWKLYNQNNPSLPVTPKSQTTAIELAITEATNFLSIQRGVIDLDCFGTQLPTIDTYACIPRLDLNTQIKGPGFKTTNKPPATWSFGSGSQIPEPLEGLSEVNDKISGEKTFDLWGESVKYSDGKVRYNGDIVEKGNFIIALALFNKNEISDINTAYTALDKTYYIEESMRFTNLLQARNKVNVDFTNTKVNVNTRFAPGSTFFIDASYTLNTNINFTSSLNGLNSLGINNNLNFTGGLNNFFFSNPFNFRTSQQKDKISQNATFEPLFDTIAASEVAQGTFLQTLAGDNIEKRQLMDNLFKQALIVPLDQQTFTLQKEQKDRQATPQAELYHVLYRASKTAQEQLHGYLTNAVGSKQSMTDEWIHHLREEDADMYEKILAKLKTFIRAEGLTNHQLFPTPVYTVGVTVQPEIELNHAGTDSLQANFKRLNYQVEATLKDATIRLGIDHNCDYTAELGVVLSEEETNFLQKSWGEDTDEDGMIDQGFVLEVQKRLQSAETLVGVSMWTGAHAHYIALNQAMEAMVSAEMFKDMRRRGVKMTNTVDVKTIDSGNLSQYQLAASYDTDIEGTEQSKAIYEIEGLNALNTVESAITILPFKPKASSKEDFTNAKTAGVAGYSAAVVFEGTSYVSKSPTILAVGKPHVGKLIITNTGATKTNEYFKVRVTNGQEVGHFNVFGVKINQINAGETQTFHFVFHPTTKGGLTFQVRKEKDGGIVSTTGVNVVERVVDAANVSAYCRLPTANNGAVASGQTVQAAGGLVTSTAKVNNGGNLQLRATGTIKLNPGFHANLGSKFSATITSCAAVSNIVSATLK